MATDRLARADAGVAAIIGTGEQAWHHALAMREVREISEMRVWGRSTQNARALADRLSQETDCPIVVSETVQQAVDGADMISTVTAAREPVLLADWVQPGAHINLVGSSFDGPREIDNALIARSRLFADSSASVRAQGAEFRHALKSGAISDAHLLGEIGEVLSGKIDGRVGADDITIYNSLGHVIQDIAAAALIFQKARAGA